MACRLGPPQMVRALAWVWQFLAQQNSNRKGKVMHMLKRMPLWLAGWMVLLVAGAYVVKASGPQIDLQPGSTPNCVNPKSKGTIPVAINGLTTGEESAAVADPTLVKAWSVPGATLAQATPAVNCAIEDVPGFGDSADLVCHFAMPLPGYTDSPPTNCETLLVSTQAGIGSTSICNPKGTTCSGS
jgi:hypothetical protein